MSDPTENGDNAAFSVDFEVVTVDGERGRRLAEVQAAAILDALEWLYMRAHNGDFGQGIAS